MKNWLKKIYSLTFPKSKRFERFLIVALMMFSLGTSFYLGYESGFVSKWRVVSGTGEDYYGETLRYIDNRRCVVIDESKTICGDFDIIQLY